MIKKCDSPKHGDYQCSLAMPVFASLKKSRKPIPTDMKGPQQVAQAIIDRVGKDHQVIDEMRIQGPGFIMCKISPVYLQGHIESIMRMKSLPKPIPVGPQQTCLVDFSSPNIASKLYFRITIHIIFSLLRPMAILLPINFLLAQHDTIFDHHFVFYSLLQYHFKRRCM